MTAKHSKINVSIEIDKKLSLICLLGQVSKKSFVESLINDYIKRHPFPSGLGITKDYSLKSLKIEGTK